MARKPRHETARRNREIAARASEGAPALAEAFGLSRPHVYRILAKAGVVPEQASAEPAVSPMRTAQIVERGRFSRSRVSGYAARRVDGDTFTGLAKSGLKRFGNSVDDDYDRVFRKGLRSRVAIYREMGDDPVCHAVMHAAKQMIRRVRWYVEPGGPTKADTEAAEFVQQCMEDMSSSWSAVIDGATDMIQYGFSVAEVVNKKRKGPDADVPSKYDDGRIGWRKFQYMAPDSLAPGNEWEWEEEDGGLRGLNQQAPPAYATTFLPIEKLVLFRTTESRGNPEGRSILRGMYKPWYFKTNLEEIEAISAERMGAGFPVVYAGTDVGKGSDDDSDLNLIKDIARNIRTDEQMSVVFPFPKMGTGASDGKGVLLELIRPEGSSVDFGAIINRYEQRMAMVGLGQFLMLGMSKIGTQSLAIEQGDTFVLALDGWLMMICDVLNRYAVERLMRLNHFPGLTAMPILRSETVGKVDLAAFAQALNNLVGVQLLTPGPEIEDYVRKLFDLPKRPTTQPGAKTAPAQDGAEGDDNQGDDKPGEDKPGGGPNTPEPVDQGDGGTEKAAEAPVGEPVEVDPVKSDPTRGIMVAFEIPEHAREALALEGGEAEDQLHLTLAIVNVPDTGSLTDDMRGLIEVVRAFAQDYRGLGAMVTGPAMFAPDPDGTVPVVALVDVPTLPEFRADLVGAIEAAGYTIKRNHGYIPHITRIYAPALIDRLPETPLVPMVLSTLVVAEDDLWVPISLEGGADYGRALSDFDAIAERHGLAVEHFNPALPDEFARGSGPGRRPAAETAVNEYEESLRQTYQIWADETAANMAEAEDDSMREEILMAALAVLLLKLRDAGRRRLPEAARLALSNAQGGYTPEMLRLVADTVAGNDAYLTNLTTNDIPAKVRDALRDPDVQTALAGGVGKAVLAGILAKFLGRVGSYAGAWWGLHNRVVGLDFDEQRAAKLAGEKGAAAAGTPVLAQDDDGEDGYPGDVALFWRLEPGANHCASCLEFGNQLYTSYQDLLIRTGGVTPGDGTDCGGNCRCKLGAATREQIAAYMSADRVGASAGKEAGNTSPFDVGGDVEALHHGPGAHKGTGTPQLIHGFKYGRSIGNYRAHRKKLSDEMWEEYKRRARARIAGGGGGGSPGGGGETKPDTPKEQSWEEKREAARQAIIARSTEMEERVTRLEGELEAVRQTRYALDAESNQFLNAAQNKPENIGKTMRDWDDETKAGIEDINARYREITAKRTAVQEQLRDAQRDLKMLDHPELMAENPIQLQPNIKKVGKTLAENQAGLQSFSNMVDGSNMPGATGPVPVDVIGDRTTRSYFAPMENRVHMSQRYGDADTMVHEMGHWLETNNPNVLQASLAFRDQRTAGESLIQMRQVTGNAGYRSNEVTLRDKFENAYSGKVYRDRGGNHYATEIVSMGLEQMHRSPARFARNDPGYFNYIYDVMKGRYANGMPASGMPSYTVETVTP